MNNTSNISGNPEVDIEILICTHNRSGLLARVLESINNARKPENVHFGVFVVINACTDDTVSLVKTYQEEALVRNWLPIRWLEVAEAGKSIALNEALPNVKSPVVAFVDDDHRVHEDYLCNIAKAIDRYPETQLFCGRIFPDWDGREPEWIHNEGQYRIYPLPIPRFDQGSKPKVIGKGTVTPGGGDLFMRTALFSKVGEFSLELGPKGHNLGGAEDIEWVRRAISKGVTLQYVPDVIQYHYVDTARLRTSYLIKKAYERTCSTVRISRDIHQNDNIPLYMFRKIMNYAVQSAISLSSTRRRYFIVRLSASVGELKGFILGRANARKGVSR